MTAALHIPDSTVTAASLQVQRSNAPRWSRAALSGRLVEIVDQPGLAPLAATAHILLQAQHEREPTAWISTRDDLPVAEDLAAIGLDIGAILYVSTPDAASAGLAADRLLRSSAFGVVVIDLGPNQTLPIAQLGRLARLADLHDAVAMILVEHTNHGSLVALRARAERVRRSGGRFAVRVEADKDKRNGPGNLSMLELRHGPAGLR